MKKFFILSIFILVSSFLVAGNFFNIGDQESTMGFFFGAFYSYQSRDVYIGEAVDQIYYLKQVGYYGMAGIHLTDGFSIYGIAGFNDYKFEDNIDGEYDLRYGGGLRIRLYDFGRIALRSGERESRTFGLSIIGDLQLNYFKGAGIYVEDLVDGEISWLEYSGTVAIKGMVDTFGFYFGGRVSYLDGTFTPEFMGETDFSNDGWFSAIIGGSFDLFTRMRLGAELAVFAETSIAINVQFSL